MVTELADIIGLLKLGCIKQALGFVGKLVSNKAQTRESLSEVLNQLYLYSQDVIKQKRFKVALQVLKVLEELSRLLKDPGKMCDVKNTVSFCYRACGLYDQSLTKCLEALEIVSENFSIRSKLPALHLNACAIYREDFKDLINSKIHAELAYYYGKETYTPSESCKRTLAICIYNCGYISDELNDFKSAEKWYKEALEYCAEEWKDQGMIKNLKYKLKNLEMKIKIFSKRLRPLNISEIQLYALKGLNHSPYKSPGKIRLPRSQCSKRPKNYYSNASTPVPLKSTPSNEKSTGPSSPHDPQYMFDYSNEHEFYNLNNEILEQERRERKNSFIDLLSAPMPIYDLPSIDCLQIDLDFAFTDSTRTQRSESSHSDNEILRNDFYPIEKSNKNPGDVIGTLTRLKRNQKIQKYLEKRKKRIWKKRISYDCRKKVADKRLRIKGRFVTREQAILILGKDHALLQSLD